MSVKIENVGTNVNHVVVTANGLTLDVRVVDGVLMLDAYDVNEVTDAHTPVACYNAEVEAAVREAEDFQRDPMDMYPS